MKKILSLLIILIFVVSLVSCAETFDKATKRYMEIIPNGQIYTQEQIDAVQATHDKHEHFNGKILSIAHFPTLDSSGKIVYVYIYEFELEADAEFWYDNVTTGWLYARKSGNVVAYGTNPVIERIRF